jgi:aspartyl/asparaginyl beta-hydroxylase (cupin superfamily)
MASTSKAPLATILQSAVCRTRVRQRPAPSLFYFPGLTSKPVWDSKLFTWKEEIERNLNTFVAEYKQLKANQPGSDYVTQEEHKLHAGKWDWNSYIIKGRRQADFAAHCPKTVAFLESLSTPGLMTGTPFSFAFFSTLHPGSTIAPHYGPCNLRLRCHFPLVVPTSGSCGMQVGDETVVWKAGEPVIFDDCYQHRVWNESKEERVLLLFDVW